jgi:hypothetical protein
LFVQQLSARSWLKQLPVFFQIQSHLILPPVCSKLVEPWLRQADFLDHTPVALPPSNLIPKIRFYHWKFHAKARTYAAQTSFGHKELSFCLKLKAYWP